ncbi:MAG: N-acetyltransferase family protein [Pseudomonadota bacterium]
MTFEIRPTEKTDLPVITDVYAHHVETGLASFETDPPDLAEMASRYAGIVEANCPYIVATYGGSIAGYAYAGPFHKRHAYRGTVEDSIYLSPAAQGKGIGSALLARLIADCEERGFRQMIALITRLDPPISVRIHEKAGFETAGILRDVGFKQDRWLDVVYMQRTLGSGATAPL